MTQFVPKLPLSLFLSGAVVAGRFVTPLGAQTGADGNALGVARTSGDAGECITVDCLGTALVEAGAAVAAGATIKADAAGRAIEWDTSGARLGIARQAASAAGELIEVFLIPNAA